MGVSDKMPVELEESNARDGWILESRVYQQGRTEISPLLVQPLTYHIMISARSHGFLNILEITQKSSSGGKGGGGVYHKPRGGGYASEMWARNELSDKYKRLEAPSVMQFYCPG